jgi:ABC-2 type transport system permease protein
MPVTPFEIMVSKIWSMGLVVLTASAFSLMFVIHGLLAVPIEGSFALFIAGTTLYLFATTSLGIFLATQAGSMPQFGLLLMLALLPLQVLSGTLTPRESMPELIRYVMLAAPNTHFVMMAQFSLPPEYGLGLSPRPSTTLAECVCATVFQGFAFGSTDTTEPAAAG